MRVTFLGTAAARPTPGRNVSAILIERGAIAILLDCGEGTQRQLLRYSGGRGVAAIFITHMHADHYLGVPGLVSACALDGGPVPSSVWAPAGGMEEMHAALELSGVVRAERPTVETARRREQIHLGDLRITPYRTRHRAGSVGYVVEAADAYRTRVVYTGDTAPSASTIRAAEGADLLIHEATFCDEEQDRARQTAHSTASQAARIARDATARRLALTHLSARYSQDPGVLRAEARAVFPATVVARDGMVVDLARTAEN